MRSRLTKVTGALSGKTTEYSYLARNELQWMSEPSGQCWDLSYDARGNLTKKADSDYPEYYFADYYWDSQDRLTKVYIFDDYLAINRTVEYKYDLMGRRVAKKGGDGEWTVSRFRETTHATFGRAQGGKSREGRPDCRATCRWLAMTPLVNSVPLH